MPETIRVEVAYVAADAQFLRTLELPTTATVSDAISQSGVESTCDIDASALDVGIWSKPVDRDRVLRQGDRVEIYRPLKIDPKDARRKRAARKNS
jgi:putative ubiquitin-RnfH superfamily antitoxin RatB of RatAB toxin-antitoxin module